MNMSLEVGSNHQCDGIEFLTRNQLFLTHL